MAHLKSEDKSEFNRKQTPVHRFVVVGVECIRRLPIANIPERTERHGRLIVLLITLQVVMQVCECVPADVRASEELQIPCRGMESRDIHVREGPVHVAIQGPVG